MTDLLLLLDTLKVAHSGSMTSSTSIIYALVWSNTSDGRLKVLKTAYKTDSIRALLNFSLRCDVSTIINVTIRDGNAFWPRIVMVRSCRLFFHRSLSPFLSHKSYILRSKIKVTHVSCIREASSNAHNNELFEVLKPRVATKYYPQYVLGGKIEEKTNILSILRNESELCRHNDPPTSTNIKKTTSEMRWPRIELGAAAGC